MAQWMWPVKHRSTQLIQDYITADETRSIVSHLRLGFSLIFCSVEAFTLSDDILHTSLRHSENLELILVLYKHESVGCTNTCFEQRNNNGWWSFRPHAFSYWGSFVSITHTETFLFSFSITCLKAIGIPEKSKQSFYQSITRNGGTYLCAFKKWKLFIKPFLKTHSSASLSPSNLKWTQ